MWLKHSKLVVKAKHEHDVTTKQAQGTDFYAGNDTEKDGLNLGALKNVACLN